LTASAEEYISSAQPWDLKAQINSEWQDVGECGTNGCSSRFEAYEFAKRVSEIFMESIVIRPSRRHVMRLFFGSFAFTVGGIFWLIFPNLAGPRAAFLSNWFPYIVISFFGLCAIIYALKLVSKKPELVVDSNGIANSVGFIPWSNFANAHLVDATPFALAAPKHKRIEYIVIDLKNTEDFLRTIGLINRFWQRLTLSMFGYAVTISGNCFSMPLEELLANINLYARKYVSKMDSRNLSTQNYES
jgi:hypothetical protein